MQRARRRLGRLARPLAQIVVTHRDALAVEAQHEQVLRRFRLAQPCRVELVEVLRRPHRQLLDLPLGHARAGALVDQLDHLVERGLRTLLGDDPPHFERVFLLGQAERRVERRDRRHANRAVQPARHGDLAEGRLDRARTRAHVWPRDAVGADYLDGLLGRAARVDVRLQQGRG